MSDNKFMLSTDDVLGFLYQEYVTEIRSMALSKPSEYFALRREVLRKIKSDAVGNLYKTLFNVLSLGTDLRGNPIGTLGTGNLVPHFPSQKINDFAIKIASMMADELNKAIDIILPDDFDKIASGKLSLKARGGIIE
jgi:hypothetical protein